MALLVSTGRGVSGCALSFLHSLQRSFHLDGDRCGQGWSQPRRLEDGADERMRHSPTDKTSTCDAKPGEMPDVNLHAHVLTWHQTKDDAPLQQIQYVQGSAKKDGPRLREFCRQSQAEVIRKSRKKIHQTWGPLFIRFLSISLKIF